MEGRRGRLVRLRHAGGGMADRGRARASREANDGNLYELPTTGGTPTLAVAGFTADAFAVTDDAYLYGFSTLGYYSMPR